MRRFLHALLARSGDYCHHACLTLTAIHPDGQHRTPSRHIPLDRPDLLDDALDRLLVANALGWGAFVAVGLRRHGLTRYQRGGAKDILAMPAVFVDLDDPTSDALGRLRSIQPKPSCIAFTGGGYHAYWWLDQPLSDMALARRILHGLQDVTGGDPLSVANSLRLPGSINTKPGRNNALCRIVDIQDQYYPVEAFAHLLPRQTNPAKRQRPQRNAVTRGSGRAINPVLLQVVTDQLTNMGYLQRGDWLSGPCLFSSQHRHDDAHHSFGFNTRTGYGNCFRCGSMLLKDICTVISIHPADFGGMYL